MKTYLYCNLIEFDMGVNVDPIVMRAHCWFHADNDCEAERVTQAVEDLRTKAMGPRTKGVYGFREAEPGEIEEDKLPFISKWVMEFYQAALPIDVKPQRALLKRIK